MGILAKIGAWAIIPLLYFHLNLNGQDLDELYFGTDETFEVMTWNIEWFPKNNQITVDYVTQIIQALDVDILAIQEVDDTDMFNQMLYGLPEYTGYLESEWFAGLAYIYKTDIIEINDELELKLSLQKLYIPVKRENKIKVVKISKSGVKISGF